MEIRQQRFLFFNNINNANLLIHSFCFFLYYDIVLKFSLKFRTKNYIKNFNCKCTHLNHPKKNVEKKNTFLHYN